MALVLMAKAFKLNYSTPTNNNQRILSNPCNRQIPQLGMNMGQDRLIQMVRGNGRNQFRQCVGQNVRNQNGYNAVQNNPNGNGNVAAVRAEGNATGNNDNQIMCYNYRGLGHLARNCTVRLRRRDAAYLKTQFLIAKNEEARIQLQAEQFNLMAAATDKAPVYDSDGSAEVHNYNNCYDNEIFNMFTQEEKYIKLLEPILKPHQVQQNDSNVISEIGKFEIQFLKEATKFVRDFKSLAKEADESLAKHKALELEIERLFRAVVSQDIMSIVQSNSVVDTSNLQTKLDRMKVRFENCIIKKENEYAKLWNDWYKKCEECKYEKISYDEAYNYMQQNIEQLQAQLGNLKSKSEDTPCVSDTFDPLSQKLENENVELEFQALNYAKENAHLKTTYKNLFDSISVTRTQQKIVIDSLQNKLPDMI
nr:hypothetical protein [Tanacetum cinerariifolium]